MTLIQAWCNSLGLLKPKNAQLFAMVTLKSIIESYKLLFKYFWWAFALIIGCYVTWLWHITRFGPIDSIITDSAGFVTRWLFQFLLFAACLATRPSIAKKNCAYFRSYMFSFLYIALYLLVFPWYAWPTAFSSYDIFLTLFFLDSARGPKSFLLSLWYALKMTVYNFPLLIVVGFLFSLPAYFYSMMTIVLSAPDGKMMAQTLEYMFIGKSIFSLLVMPVGVCTFANIYIQKLHDQFDLYVKQPQ
jgi:hypothetical protein